MVLVYATAADLATWTGQPAPANAAQLLRSASILVRRDTRTAIYDTDAAGKPSDTDVAEGFRDATCSQAATWASLGIDPAAQGTDTTAVASKSLGPRSVSYAGAETAAAARARLVDELTDEAAQILADLDIWYGVQVTG